MKRLLSFILGFALIYTVAPVSVFAEEQGSPPNNVDSIMCVRIWDNPNSSEKEACGSADDGTFRYGEQIISEIIQSESTSIITTPSGQPTKGFSFPSTGGSIYVDVNGGPTITYSIGVTWGYVSVGVSIGETSSATGVSVNVPGDGNYYKVQLRHNYIIHQVKHDYYQYGEYLYTIYTDNPVLQNTYVLLIRV